MPEHGDEMVSRAELGRLLGGETHGAGAKTEVVLRICRSERLARSAAPACSGEGLAWGASCVPIRNGRVTKRSASACKCGCTR